MNWTTATDRMTVFVFCSCLLALGEHCSSEIHQDVWFVESVIIVNSVAVVFLAETGIVTLTV